MCQPRLNCADLGKTGLVGSGCSNVVFYDDGSGGSPDLACPCSTASQPNNVCTGFSGAQEGTCTCVGNPCPVGTVGQFFNGCTTVTCMGG